MNETNYLAHSIIFSFPSFFENQLCRNYRSTAKSSNFRSFDKKIICRNMINSTCLACPMKYFFHPRINRIDTYAKYERRNRNNGRIFVQSDYAINAYLGNLAVYGSWKSAGKIRTMTLDGWSSYTTPCIEFNKQSPKDQRKS